jgi:ankyrin repeat protein
MPIIIENAKAVMAALNGHDVEALKVMLDGEFDIEGSLRDGENYTALHFAAACSFIEGCRLLLERGADGNALCSLGVGALHIAANRDCVATCEMLIEAGANVRVVSHCDETALHWAALAGATRACAVLVRAGLDLNAEDRLGQTPLHLASKPATFAYLVSAGANHAHLPAMTTKDYLTPFQLAVQRVWVEHVKYCLERGGVDLEQKTLDGRRLVDLTGRRRAVRDLLLQARVKTLASQEF